MLKTYICESRRLISDVIVIAKIKKLEGFLVTIDVEKAFDSLYHNFLILLRDRESCVINGSTTTKYFSLGRGAQEGDHFQLFYIF